MIDRFKHFCSLLLIISIVIPRMGFSSDKPNITIPVIMKTKYSGKFYKNLASAFDKSGSFSSVKLVSIDTFPTSEKKEIARCKNDFNQASKLYNEGRKNYNNLDFSSAIIKFQAAIKNFEETYLCNTKPKYLIRSYLYLGLSYLAKKVISRGYVNFRKALLIQPDLTLGDKEFSPQIRKEFNDFKKKLLKEKPGNIKITIEPADALLFVNGIKTKARNINLFAGNHYLMAGKKGYLPQVQNIYTTEGQKKTVSIKLGPVKNKKIANISPLNVNQNISNNKLSFLKNICTDQKSDLLVLQILEPITKKEFQFSIQIFDARITEFSSVYSQRLHIKEINKFHALARDITNCFNQEGFLISNCSKTEDFSTQFNIVEENNDTEGKLTSIDGLDSIPEKSESSSDLVISKRPYYKTWWFWTIMILAAGGTGAGGYFLYDYLDNQNNTVDEMPESGNISITFPGGSF